MQKPPTGPRPKHPNLGVTVIDKRFGLNAVGVMMGKRLKNPPGDIADAGRVPTEIMRLGGLSRTTLWRVTRSTARSSCVVAHYWSQKAAADMSAATRA